MALDWETERKPALMARLTAMSREEKQDIIARARVYRSGADSNGSVYMGGHAVAALLHALGGTREASNLTELLEKATEEQLDAALEVCCPYIDTMEANPTKKCPCCEQIVPDTGEKHTVSILWGSAPEKGQEADTYEFDTLLELNTFMLGVQAAEGWLDYTEVEEGYVHDPEADDETSDDSATNGGGD